MNTGLGENLDRALRGVLEEQRANEAEAGVSGEYFADCNVARSTRCAHRGQGNPSFTCSPAHPAYTRSSYSGAIDSNNAAASAG